MSKRILMGVVIITLLLSTGSVCKTAWGAPFELEQLYEQSFIKMLLHNPEAVEQIGLANQPLLQLVGSELTDVSPHRQEANITELENDLRVLEQFPRESLSTQEQISYDVYAWFLKNELKGKSFGLQCYPVNHYDGVQEQLLEFLLTVHPITEKQSAERYIKRLANVEKKIDGLVESVAVQVERGFIPPRFVLEKTLAQLRVFTATAPESNLLVTTFAQKLGATTLTPEEQVELSNQAVRQVHESVYPAYEKLAAEVERLLARADDRAGVWKLPAGEDYYAYKLRSYTTTNLTPEQVHQIGLREVARIEQEMNEVIKELGLAGVKPGKFMQNCAKERRFQYTDTATGRQAAIEAYQRAITANSANTVGCFALLPQGKIEVCPVPKSRELTSSLAYLMPVSADGLRPSILYVNLGKMSDVLAYNIKSLAAHEAFPGHHVQRGLQRQLKNVPLFRKAVPFPAFAEGWAMYAEQLAWEQNPTKDPYENLGRLQTELWRAARLVVDTGIHYKRWTRQRAIDYMRDTTGLPENAVENEVDRYIVDPGQACAYKIGMLKFLDCRQRAKDALGEQFKLTEFHAVVLENGALPLELLDQAIERYIAKRRTS